MRRSHKKHTSFFVLVFLLAVFSVSCSSLAPDPTLTPTASNTETAAATLTHTVTFTHTATNSATITLTPSETLLPTPSETPAPEQVVGSAIANGNCRVGPSEAYIADAKLIDYLGFGPLAPNMGLFHTVSSTQDHVNISFLSTAEFLQDGDDYRTSLEASWERVSAL